MLEVIGNIVLAYYLVLGGALLICLVLGILEDLGRANRRRRETRIWHVTHAQSGRQPDNVVRFKHSK
jgi:hypothetical protein